MSHFMKRFESNLPGYQASCSLTLKLIELFARRSKMYHNSAVLDGIFPLFFSHAMNILLSHRIREHPCELIKRCLKPSV